MKRSSTLAILATAFLLCFASTSLAQKPFRILAPDTIKYDLVPGGAFIYTPLQIENLTDDTITLYDAGDINFESEAYTSLLEEIYIIDDGSNNSDSALNAKMSLLPFETKEFMTVSLFDIEEYPTTAASSITKTFDWDDIDMTDSTWWEAEDSAVTPYYVQAMATFTGMGPYWDDFNQEYTIYADQSIGAPVMFYGPDDLGPAKFHFSNLTTEPILVTDVSLWHNKGIEITNTSHGAPPFTLGVNEVLSIEVSYIDESAVPIDHLIVQTRSPLDLKKFMLIDPGMMNVDGQKHASAEPKLNATIYPNPATESVQLSLDGAQDLKVRIYDVQGVKVFDGHASQSLNWDRTNNVGEKVAAGAYRVVIEGRDNFGKTVTASGQMIVQ